MKLYCLWEVRGERKYNMINQNKIKMQYLSGGGFIAQGKCKITF